MWPSPKSTRPGYGHFGGGIVLTALGIVLSVCAFPPSTPIVLCVSLTISTINIVSGSRFEPRFGPNWSPNWSPNWCPKLGRHQGPDRDPKLAPIRPLTGPDGAA